LSATAELPDLLIRWLNALPEGLQAHVERVRGIARELALVHGIDQVLTDTAAAAHDIARHLPAKRLLEEAESLELAVSDVERAAPILLHGAVGAAWLDQHDTITDTDILEAVRWHTSAHPDLSPLGQAVFLADKLDPAKERAYPFQQEVREAAFLDMHQGVLAFIDGAIKLHIERHELVHPMSSETRNRLIISLSC